MKLFFQYILDKRLAIFTYIGIIGLFASTFFLYEIPLFVYSDALLFSALLIVTVMTIQFSFYARKHRQLREGIQAPKLQKFQRNTSYSLLEKDYEQLLVALEKEYRADVDVLEAANQQLMDYYSMWSHQIKTPIAVLNLKMQENELDQTVLRQELFKVDQYLDMMLQYLRMNHTETDFVFEEIKLDQLVKDTVKKYAVFFIHKNLSFSLEPTNQIIISDKKWLQFVLEQVLFNAIKYTNQGGIKVYMNNDTPFELIIEDTGIGILAEDAIRVFERGYTGFNGRTYQKASGLGLFMSKEILTKLGHQICLTSEVGIGTKVRLELTQKVFEME
ncbi:hypothetical protein ATZ33_12615 [Enterococcus silesiacus]|uniref:histidine kinase n=1 Tax=Enterococcus silesiacus TaxID=332949 RepID=A0A0S3KD84_9ENTE|nr:sensor histidine kinase [Enterococcus silesiacus]ALS02194.1 hypothetical protein ATZ33_12615 [Enterococcus silesiacus]OJG92451.1 hypothetical protein RV15_GL003244 [Enterococcus silesiacus]